MRREGVPFHIVCANLNINDEVREGFNLAVPRFGEGGAGVVVGGFSGLGRKVKRRGWIVRIGKGCASG